MYVRRILVMTVMLSALLSVVVGRLVYIQVVDHTMLASQGDQRTLRTDVLPASRGMIVDRNNQPLAVSTPMTTIFADPRKISPEQLPSIAADLGMDAGELIERYQRFQNKAFMYLERRMVPQQADAVLANNYAGVYGMTEYQRFYPAGEVLANVLGFTDVDGQGIEGLERTYDEMMQPELGAVDVVKDVRGRVIRVIEETAAPEDGRDLQLTIDTQLQYLAYRELKAAVEARNAKGGSVVIMDPRSGDILALANQPSFNPNDRSSVDPNGLRNRAVIDPFEPGSVIKPFTVAAALESGEYGVYTLVDTAPGFMRVTGHTIRDSGNYGEISLSDIIRRSSNVGASKLAMHIGAQDVWSALWDSGIGQPLNLGFPAETNGQLTNRPRWSDAQTATMSYGYGFTTSAVHLARAYSAIANDGVLPPARLVQGVQTDQPKRVFSEQTATDVRRMLGSVVEDGTGRRAGLTLYTAGGKTGTVHKVGANGYDDNRYRSTFVGMAPVERPEMVVVITIDEPQGEEYYGGEVAAPLFSGILNRALPMAGVVPDKDQPQLARGE